MPIPLVVARTHPPEYRLHKYWSRKPHNVLARFIEELLPDRGTLVDPFCGSGVLLREAALRGHRAIGTDLNPAAVLISRVTCRPPDPRAFRDALAPALDRFERLCAAAYGTGPDGRPIRFAVHQIEVDCPACGARVAAGQAGGQGRRRTCPGCGQALRFNLASLCGTRVEALGLQGQRALCRDPAACADQHDRSARRSGRAMLPDPELPENRRILAFSGMRVSDLFTARNHSLLSAFAQAVGEIADRELRDAGRLLLTAAAAQCSRLIAFRNNLSTGGPAWSVPGFWVPPVHLETNPVVHVQARLAKLCAGFERLAARPVQAPVEVHCEDAARGLERFARQGDRADLVFLDPPYGDSVAYLEFSALWNALLGESCDPAGDLSVSDRTGQADPWQAYRAGLARVLQRVERILAPQGRLLITFNNHDPRAWHALLAGLQTAGLRCDSVTYQLPAVVPAKACFSPKNSYQGDLYAVFRRRTSQERPGDDLTPVREALRRAAAVRGGRLAANLAQRTATVAFVEHDLDVGLLPERDRLLAALFADAGEGLLRWRGPLPAEGPRLADLVRGAVAARLCQGPADWTELLEAVAEATLSVGMPEPAEIKASLADDEQLSRVLLAAG